MLGEILEPLGTHLSLQGGAGGEFIYSEPGYTALIDSAAAVGGVAIGLPLNPQMQNDLSAISARLNRHTRAVFLVNPHNPTGLLSDADQLRNFARAASRQALIIVDEAYMEFAEHYGRHTLVDLVRDGHNAIVFRTFAKAYGLAGLDIGYGLVPRPLAQALSARDRRRRREPQGYALCDWRLDARGPGARKVVSDVSSIEREIHRVQCQLRVLRDRSAPRRFRGNITGKGCRHRACIPTV